MNGVSMATWKVPEIPGCHIHDFHVTRLVYRRDLAVTTEHERPLVRVMPVHLTAAAGIDEQMRAGERSRNRKGSTCDLARPATRSLLQRRPVQRCREGRRFAGFAWD